MSKIKTFYVNTATGKETECIIPRSYYIGDIPRYDLTLKGGGRVYGAFNKNIRRCKKEGN